MNAETQVRTIPPELAGQRLDRALAALFPEYSRSVLETLRQPIETGDVVVAIVVGGNADSNPEAGVIVTAEQILAELLPHVPGKKAADIAARISGERRNDVYALMLGMKDEV